VERLSAMIFTLLSLVAQPLFRDRRVQGLREGMREVSGET